MIMAVIAPLLFILMFLNIASGIIGGIWLLFLGAWKLVFFMISLSICSPFIISFAALPGTFVSHLSLMLLENRNSFLGLSLMLLSNFWTVALIVVWQFGSVLLFGLFDTYQYPLIPVWLLMWSVATGVWNYVARQEDPSSLGSLIGLSAQLSFILLSICLFLGVAPIKSAIVSSIPLFFFSFLSIYAGSRYINQVNLQAFKPRRSNES